MSEQEKKKILIIEDDQSLQSALVEIIQQEGFETESAFDGEEGLAKARSFGPDLILLDIILPKKDGFELLSEIKKDEATKNIPVLVLTNLEEVNNIQKALDLGANSYLVKSDFSLKEVVEKVKAILK
jgi:DNA-binding response OmpR family regulator